MNSEIKDEVKKIRESIASVGSLISEAEEEFLYKTAKTINKPGVIVEIGSWKGRSTVLIAKGSERGGKLPVYAVDPHFNTHQHQGFGGTSPDTYEEFLRNIRESGVEHIVRPIRKTSEEAAKGWKEPIAFLWIDGGHRYEDVSQDFRLWWPHLVEGGTIAFHDSTSGDVKKFMHEILRSGFSDAGLVDSITYGVKASGAPAIAKARYVLFLIDLHEVFRKILPPSLRKLVKGPARRFMQSMRLF